MSSAPRQRTLLNHPLVHQVRRTIEKHRLADRHSNAPIIVALSGGADSTALLRVLHLLGYPCVAAHCNFHLRDAESDRDEAFVTALCRQMQIPLYKTEFDTIGYTESHEKTSVEMAARYLRYQYFEQLHQSLSAQCIALGHHLEDNIEQLLINLSRGSGVRGLRGMLPMRDEGRYIRPLIDTPPRLIYDFLTVARQPYVTDSTNSDTEIRRNFVRHTVRPLFNRLNPSFDSAARSSLLFLREFETIYSSYIEQTLPEASRTTPVLSVAWLQQQIAPLSLLYETFRDIACDRDTLEQILSDLSHEAPALYEGKTGIVERYRGCLIGTTTDRLQLIEQASRYSASLPRAETWMTPQRVPHPLGCLQIEVIEKSAVAPHALSDDTFVADYDLLLKNQVNLRLHAVSGDEILSPMGMQGTKKVTKLLRDAHILPSRRKAVPILSSVRPDIPIWIVGIQRGSDYALSDRTERAARLTFHFTDPLPAPQAFFRRESSV